MAQFANKAGYYKLEEFKIFRLNEPGNYIDIKLLIHNWQLNELMNSGHMYGHAKLYDASGLFYDFLQEGLRGEEEIEITYQDFFKESITHKFFLFAITNLKYEKPANETGLTYEIHFISKPKLFTDNILIRRSFTNGLISEYVQVIFDEYFKVDGAGDITIEIEDTEGNQDLIIPNYSPEQALHFLARKAFSSNDDSQTFRFFENRRGYHFKSHNQLAFDAGNKETQLYINVQNADQTPEGQKILMQNIIDIEFPSYINTINDMIEGGYYRTTSEIDFMNRTILVNEYRYLDDYDEYALPDQIVPASIGSSSVKSKHTKKFVDENMNFFRDILVWKDYPRIINENGNFFVRPHTYYPDIYNKKNANFYHHYNNMVKLKVYGRTTNAVGDYCDIQILKADPRLNNRQIDEARSGVYLIEAIQHIFQGDMYFQVIEMSKSGIRGDKESATQYNRIPQTVNVFSEANDAAGTGGGGEGGADGSSPSESQAWSPDDALRVEELRAFNANFGGGAFSADLTEGEKAYAISRGYISSSTNTGSTTTGPQ